MSKKFYLFLMMLALVLASCSMKPKRTGISGLLNWTPADAAAVWAVDVRETQDLKALVVYGRQILESKADSAEGKQAQQAVKDLEEATGARLEDLAAAVKPAGTLVVLKGDTPAVVAMVVVADKAGLTSVLKNLEKTSKTPGKSQKVADTEATVFDTPQGQMGYALVDDCLFLFSSTKALEAALNTYHGRAPNLAQDKGLVAARKRMPSDQGAFFYSPVGPLLADLTEKKIIPGDAQTVSSLKSLGYAAALLGKDGSFDAFMEVDGKAGPLGGALLGTAHGLGATLELVPQQMDIVLSLDLHYLADLIKQLAALAPDGRGAGAIIGSLPQRLGVTESELWEILTGQVVVAIQSSSVIPDLGGSKEKATVMVLLGLKDTQKASTFLKGLPIKFDVKPDEDKVPHRSGPSAYCLVQKPDPYFMLTVAPDPESLLKSATAGDQSLAQTPVFKASPLDTKKATPIFFYLDPTQVAKGSKAESVPGLVPGYGSLTVEADGLRWTGKDSQVTAIAGVSIGAAILVPNFIRARGQGQLTACKSNQKNIATAAEMWATDHQGKYPQKLSQLTPEYLKYVPSCPAAGSDTYSASFECAAQPDAFTVYCKGHHHMAARSPKDRPLYNSYTGLMTD